jgi:glycerol uptake facilitator-like aquaporin
MCAAAVDRHFQYITMAVVFGLIYFVVTAAARHHGGAHLNPAITIAHLAAGLISAIQAIIFIVVQVFLIFQF